MPSIVDLQPELEALMAEYGLTSIHRNFKNADGRAVPNLALLMQSYNQRSNSGQYDGSFTDFVHDTYSAGQSPMYGLAPEVPPPPPSAPPGGSPPSLFFPPGSQPPSLPPIGGGMGPFPPGGGPPGGAPGGPQNGGMGPFPPGGSTPHGGVPPYASFGFTQGPNGELIPLMLGPGSSPYQTQGRTGAVSGLLGGAEQQPAGPSQPPLLGQSPQPAQMQPPQLSPLAPVMPQALPPAPPRPDWLAPTPAEIWPTLQWGPYLYGPNPPPEPNATIAP